MSKHSKAVWLEAAKEIRDRYTKKAFFEDISIRIHYGDPNYCSFCRLSDFTERCNIVACRECIYWLAQKKFKCHRKGKRLPCLRIGPVLPEFFPDSADYSTASRRRTWLDLHVIPWIKSLPAGHDFFAKEKPHD